MGSPHSKPPQGGAYSRRFTGFTGLFFDEFAPNSAWIREIATVRLPPLNSAGAIVVRGEWRPDPEARDIEKTLPNLYARFEGAESVSPSKPVPGPWQVRLQAPDAAAEEGSTLHFELLGVGATNLLAWAGRITGLPFLQRFRKQRINRQLRILSIETSEGEIIYDFSRRDSPYSSEFARRHTQLGMNVVGFITADLGIGESARGMIRAADAASIGVCAVPLKLHCKNRLGDLTYSARLTDENAQPVNVIHIDPPAARDIDHHHGKAFRSGKYNIGYFAWELTEFPNAWTGSFDYFDEIWCPSDFAREAIAAKSPVPVLTMPHCIAFDRPKEPLSELRALFGLPGDAFLFLCLFDLNSYAERKNPRAAIDAFRSARAANSRLVIKVQNAESNPTEFAELKAQVADLPDVLLLAGTYSRSEVYALEAACDAFVSLHRSEGFGFAVAECMYLGKPVISTDWSATREFVNPSNGCPVPARLVALERSHGPYAKGSLWADPDIEVAAEWMRRLSADRALGASLGAAARRTIETDYSPKAIGQRYRRRLEAIACF